MPDASSNEILIAIGNNQMRKQISERLSGSNFGNCQHKTSLIASNVIIGPRPLLVQYLALYNDFQKKRHEVRPGITGWAQINGRNAISWDEKFALDIWYLAKISFKLDLKILFLTVAKVFKSEGISPSDKVTMDVFKGNN